MAESGVYGINAATVPSNKKQVEREEVKIEAMLFL
jgi:hypothetical protein